MPLNFRGSRASVRRIHKLYGSDFFVKNFRYSFGFAEDQAARVPLYTSLTPTKFHLYFSRSINLGTNTLASTETLARTRPQAVWILLSLTGRSAMPASITFI